MHNPQQQVKPTAKFHWYNFSWQTFNYGVSGLFMILFWVFLARMWPQSTFGQFSTLFVWVSVYSLLTDLGLDFWVTRQTALDSTKAYPRILVQFKILSSLLMALLFVVAAYLAGLPMMAFAIFLSGTFILNITHFFSCYLRGVEKLSVEAKISVLRNLVFLGCAIVGVMQGLALIWVATSYAIGSIIMALVTYMALQQNGFKQSDEDFDWRGPLKAAFAVWITFLLVGLSVKLDILLLGFLQDEQSVALYSAAARIFEGGILLATAFVLTLFPALSKTYSETPQTYFNQVMHFSKLLLGLTLVAAVAGIIVGQWLFVPLYGEVYQASSELFFKLMIIFPISAQVYYLYNALVIAGRAKPVIVVLLAGVVLNAVLDWVLIPLWSIDGAFAGFAAKEGVVLVLLIALLMQMRNSKSPHLVEKGQA